MTRRFALTAAALITACSPALAAPAQPAPGRSQTAVFAGGCFWSAEKAFEHVRGVSSATSGFVGGSTSNPTYAQVVAGGSGHVEAIQVVFDPRVVSYRALVDRFWRTIDPTDPDGQFCDQGPSYATAVFATAAQRPVAEASRAAAAAVIGERRFVTPVRNAARFWPAESYHQDFARLNPVRYGGYSRFCGREARLRAVWGG